MSSGLIYTTIIATLALYCMLPNQRLPGALKPALLIGLLVVLITPVDGVSLAMAVRGAMGDLSLTTLFALTVATGASLRGKAIVTDSQWGGLLVFISLAGLALYPAGLGLGPWDPYRMGYGLALPVVLTALCGWFVYINQQLIALLIALALAGFAAGLLESNNLWDYLIDPALWIYCLVAAIKQKRFSIRRRLPV